MRARIAPALAGLALAVVPAGCGSPPADPHKLAKDLLPQAGPRCTAVFASGQTAGTPAPGSIQGPAVGVERLDARYGQSTDWGSFGYGLVPYEHSNAASAEAVRAVVCVHRDFIDIGTYRSVDAPLSSDSDIRAVRAAWDVRVLRWPSGELLASKTFPGTDPPEKTTVAPGSKFHYGGLPLVETRNWLEEMLAD